MKLVDIEERASEREKMQNEECEMVTQFNRKLSFYVYLNWLFPLAFD